MRPECHTLVTRYATPSGFFTGEYRTEYTAAYEYMQYSLAYSENARAGAESVEHAMFFLPLLTHE